MNRTQSGGDWIELTSFIYKLIKKNFEEKDTTEH